jgi:hypothetical protein
MTKSRYDRMGYDQLLEALDTLAENAPLGPSHPCPTCEKGFLAAEDKHDAEVRAARMALAHKREHMGQGEFQVRVLDRLDRIIAHLGRDTTYTV